MAFLNTQFYMNSITQDAILLEVFSVKKLAKILIFFLKTGSRNLKNTILNKHQTKDIYLGGRANDNT